MAHVLWVYVCFCMQYLRSVHVRTDLTTLLAVVFLLCLCIHVSSVHNAYMYTNALCIMPGLRDQCDDRLKASLSNLHVVGLLPIKHKNV